jgi:acyl-CoA synthetase (NDP forming)
MPGDPLLDALFRPRRVAVYGASARDESKLGNTLLRNVAGSREIEAVAVHPSAPAIDGIPACPRLDASGGPVDLALVSVPAAGVEGAVANAAAGGATVAVVLSSGFAESGDAGRAVEDRLRTIATGHGMRLVGPNCMGVVSSLGDDGWLNASYFWSLPDRSGPVAFVSQSGAFGGMFFAESRARGLGVSRFASLGNSADVVETDLLEILGADDQTEVVGMFVEGFRDGRRFVDVARRVTRQKPVVVLKAGKAAAGARAAASHTGSVAGRHAAVSAALRRAGAIEARTTDEFFDALAAAASVPMLPAKPRVAIVTISGGPGVLAADAADDAGLDLAAPSPETVQAVCALLPPFAAVGNPIDLTPQCPPASFGPAIAAVYEDAFDAVVVINCGLDIAEFGRGVIDAARRTDTPTAAFVLDVPGIRGMLDAAGIPCFASPERAVRALAAVMTP